MQEKEDLREQHSTQKETIYWCGVGWNEQNRQQLIDLTFILFDYIAFSFNTTDFKS